MSGRAGGLNDETRHTLILQVKKPLTVSDQSAFDYYCGYQFGGYEDAADVSDDRYIGSQAQLAMNWRPNRSIVATMHLVRFWLGDVVDDAGGGDQNYVRMDFSYLI